MPNRELASRLGSETARAAQTLGSGQVAVIGPEPQLTALAEAIRVHVPAVSWGPKVDLEQKVVVLGATQSKGLEFDSVLVVDPGSLVTASPRGLNDLYVALTRSSQRLTVLCLEEVPELLAGLSA
ncbi:ATP-binding domain-containing protein [Streptomyces griseoviridis]|uniref:ATP-binding domain-containing protein n=1 Tax=Streptomyces griseoviridis TaxID=45398 RepID=UPI0013E2F0D0|nr:ATP-binding domain-containing protein [Streptomyces griseoviridis]